MPEILSDNGHSLPLRQPERSRLASPSGPWSPRTAPADLLAGCESRQPELRRNARRSEAIPAVSSNGDIIHLSPETLGWDWRAHFGRPLDSSVLPTLGGVDALTILLAAPRAACLQEI